MINRAYDVNQGKIRLIIYVVGLSDDVDTFIKADAALERRVFNSIISLVPGRTDEFEKIKEKITARLKGAYAGCKDFPEAWDKIQKINLEPGKDLANLGHFCKKYAEKVLEIHENHFRVFDKDFNIFESKARELVEAECREKWKVNNTTYTLSVATTTTVLAGHAFDCYVELLHNNNCVARAFGEAKNYELLSGHLETFKQWLKDLDFKPHNSDEHPPDLAFMIAPSCPSLLKRKLELQNIQFIKAGKNVSQPETIDPTKTIELPETINPLETSQPLETIKPPGAININKAYKNALITAFRGSGMKKTTIDMLILRRDKKPYKDLDDLISDLNSTSAVKAKLKEKLDKGEICF